MTVAERTPTDEAAALFGDWVTRFGRDVESGRPEAIAAHFRADGRWRDLLAFGWAFHTYAGPELIGAQMAAQVPSAGPTNFRLATARMAPRMLRRSGRTVLEAFFDFDTAAGNGSGFVRLQVDSIEDEPKVWLLLTTLQQLRGHEELIGDHRPSGTEFSYKFSGDNWLEQRRKTQEYADRQPQVLIVGGGQAGLSIAARLGRIGVDALVVETNARVGDNWRQRYESLSLHNEVWSNHLPYLPFPESWPTFLPKDKLAGWLESYAEFMELNVWTGTRLVSAVRDEQSGVWTARVERDGTTVELTVPHLVMACGSVSGAPISPDLPGLADFAAAGGEVLHSSRFTTGRPFAGRNAIVVGTGNSGHDVAQDLHANDAAQVTIVQRGPTCVVSLVPSGTMVYSLYAEGPTDDIDFITASIPYDVLRNSYQWLTKKTCELDRELLDGLRAVGFEVDMGVDDTGFHMMYLRTGGGYYINVGCSDLIAAGEIKLANARDVDRFVPGGMQLADGRVIAADLVVLATGFETQSATIRRLLGDIVADRIGPVWGFDDEGYMNGMWTRTGQDGLWIMGGALAECRLWSRFLALQIKADLLGLLPPVNSAGQNN